MNYLAVKNYQSVQRNSYLQYSDSHQLIQLLYDGVIDSIVQAIHALEQGHSIEKKGKLISKAILLVESLRAYLNYEKGGKIAEDLGALYQYIEKKLFEANYKNNVLVLVEVKGLMEELSSGWIAIRQEALSYLKQSSEVLNHE